MDLKGSVHHIESGEPIPGLRIELWAESRRDSTSILSTETGADGVFTISVELADVRETMGAPVRKLGLKVFQEGQELQVEEGMSSWRFGVYPEDLDLEVRPSEPETETETEPEPEPEPVTAREVVTPVAETTVVEGEEDVRRTVVGRVCHADGRPVSGVLVRVFHLTLGDRPNLGEAHTDEQGRYTIRYEFEDGAADLYARAYDDELNVIGTSVVRFGAGATVALDVLATEASFRGPSELDRLSSAVTPLLDDLDLFDLDAEDVAVIVGKTGLGRTQVGRYLAALRLADETDLPVEPLYACLRAGCPASLRRLLAEDRRRIEAALVEAAERRWVSNDAAAQSIEFAEQLETAMVKASVSSETPGSLGRLLRTAGLDGPRQEVVLDTFLTHAGSLEDYWNKLRERDDFNDAAVREVQLALRLGVITANHAPMVAAIKRRYAPRYGFELAQVDRRGWFELMDTSIDGSMVGTPPDVVGRHDDERRERYADLLSHQAERAWPTAVVAQALRREARPADRDLVQFLDDNSDFDFGVHRVKAYLADETTVLTRVLDRRALERQLLAFQRVFRIAPEVGRHAVMRALLDAGLDSAQAVHAWERDAFVARFADALGGAEAAAQVHRLARAQAALALTVYAQHAEALQPPGLPVLPSLTEAVRDSEALSMAVPDYQALFGGSALVGPDDPRSVLGPSAYYVDLLSWLDSRRALQPLLSRRPDLRALQLTGATTSAELPSVDLAIELLSRALASDGPERPAATTWSSEVLMARPEHVHDKARESLNEAVYPPALPWSADLAASRAFLGLMGVARAELLQALAPPSRPADRLELAAEALGWHPTALRIAAGGGPRYDWNYWGFESAQVQTAGGERAWFQELRRARPFMTRAGLDEAALHELLGMKVANPGGISLKSATGRLDDLDHVTLERPMGADFARIHRVVRLWKGLGWSAEDLDRAVAVLGAGDLNDELVVALADLEQLRRRTGRDIAELLCWWGPLTAGMIERMVSDEAAAGRDSSPFALDDEGSELAYVGRTGEPAPMVAHAAELQASLGLDHEAFSAVLGVVARDLTGGDEPDPIDDLDLTLDTLSRLFRIVSLARSVDQRVTHIARVRRVSEADPFQGPAAALAFIDDVDRLGLDGESTDALAWVLRHDDASAARVAPSDEDWQAVLDGVRAALSDAGAQSVEPRVIEAVALGCGLPEWSASALLGRHLRSPGGQPAMTVLMALPRHAARLSDQPEAARLLVRLAKLGWVIETLDLDEDWLDWLFAKDQRWGLPKLGALPARPGDQPVPIDAWRRLVAFVETESVLDGDTPALPGLFAALERSREVFVEALAERLGWLVDDVEALTDHLELAQAAQLQQADAWIRLAGAVEVIDRTGASVDRVLGWLGEPNGQTAREIRLAARALCPADEWLAREQALRAPLRHAERDALVARLLAVDDELADEKTLEGRLLTAVGVSVDESTTRLGEAIRAVQRYVQRALLGMEPGVALSDAEAADWPDLASYEIWRRARERFLFPENELSFEEVDSASPLFERALDRLVAGGLPGDSLGDIVLDYLDGLGELAHLTVVGLYHERPTPTGLSSERLHVVARSSGLPRRYVYRQRLGARRWTPWEPIELPLGDADVLPVAVNGRLRLIWPVYSREMAGAAEGVWVQLAMCERRGTGWSDPVLSSEALWSPVEVDRAAEAAHVLRTSTSDGRVRVECLLLPLVTEHQTELTARLLGAFRLTAAGRLRVEPTGGWVQRVCPYGMRPEGNGFVSASPGRSLWLTSGDIDANGELVEATSVQVFTLTDTVGVARLEVPHQYGDFASQDVFFVEDEERVFFVERAGGALADELHRLMERDQADPTAVARLVDRALIERRAPELDEPATSGIPYYAEPPEPDEATLQDADRSLCVPDAEGLEGGRQKLLDTHRLLSAFEREEGDPFWLRGLRARYVFTLHSHPVANDLLALAAREGVGAILDPPTVGPGSELSRQQLVRRFFKRVYVPEAVDRPLPDEAIRFEPDDANAVYNWELFVFLPLAVASALSNVGEFAEAEAWFRCVFDPTSRESEVEAPQRYWRAKPLAKPGAMPLQQFLQLLGEARDPSTRKHLEDRLADWVDDPDDLHALARLRAQTYRLAVVMAYLDHLLDWAEALRSDGSPGALAQASDLYDRARGILGPPPSLHRGEVEDLSYEGLSEGGKGGVSKVLVAVENLVGVRRHVGPDRARWLPSLGPVGPFQIPVNPRLLAYWKLLDPTHD